MYFAVAGATKEKRRYFEGDPTDLNSFELAYDFCDSPTLALAGGRELEG